MPKTNARLQNSTLSESSDAILKMQGVNWLTRKVIGMATITLTMDQCIDEATKDILLDIESQPSGGMPASQEKRVLNWQPVELNHPLFGNIRGKSRQVKVSELEDAYLSSGWEDGTENLYHFNTEHLDKKGVVTQQVLGFAVIDGVRRQVRRVLITGPSERLEVRLVYDYIGAE